jgi:16S rRNA (adenine1518-N6/adenine1519-N6)-dimethyltransferase
MNLVEMRRVLDRGGIQLTRSMGQNFLHDANQLQRIVAAAELTRQDKVLEIGPGLGPLTELLLKASGELLAIEKDQRLVDFLVKHFGLDQEARPAGEAWEKANTPGADAAADAPLHLLHEDALDWLQAEARDWRGWKLVANLPYSVASPILVELARAPHPPERMVVTLQFEVVQRIIAAADTDDYGLLSLLLQLRYRPGDWFKIPSTCFFPSPDVDSACVTLFRREQELLPWELHDAFRKLVKLAFSQRRKMMLKLLKQQWPADRLAAVFDQLGISHQERAEKVSLEKFVSLTQLLHSKTGA